MRNSFLSLRAPKGRSNLILIITIFFISIFYLQGLDRLGLEFKPDENYYYQSIRKMVETGDFITPYYFNKKRFEKPILYYWFAAASIKFFGPSWAAARGTSLLFSILFLILLYNFCLSFYDRKIAFLAVLISATFLCFFRYARILLPESAFLFFLFAFLYLFLKEILKPGNRINFLLAYICLGLAILLKGPVAVIIAFFTLFLYSRIAKRPIPWRNIYLKEGLFIMCVIVFPWFIYMIRLHGGEYLNHIFFREIKMRMFFGSGRGCRPLYYIPVILYFYLPWIIFAPYALYSEFKRRKKQKTDSGIFLFSYLIVIFVFFSLIQEKHRHYMLYLTPALAVFIAKNLIEKLNSAAMRKIIAAIFVITIQAMYFFGIAISRNAYTLDKIFSGAGCKFEEGDYFAVGSYEINPHILEANILRPVRQMGFNWPDKKEAFRETMNNINHNHFLSAPGHAFLLLSKEDYNRFHFLPKVRKTIKVIGSGCVAKKPDIRNIYKSILKRDKKMFWDSFRCETVFITNKLL